MSAPDREAEENLSGLEARLSKYWQLEAINAGLLPIAALVSVISLGDHVRWPLLVCLAANSILLVIGACYWRIEYLRLRGQPEPYAVWLPRLATAEPLGFGAALLAVISLIAECALSREAFGPTFWFTAGMALLAVLEYINYYRWQLQYFDHLPDFRALVKRRRLKRAHMARAIKRWRARRSEPARD